MSKNKMRARERRYSQRRVAPSSPERLQISAYWRGFLQAGRCLRRVSCPHASPTCLTQILPTVSRLQRMRCASRATDLKVPTPPAASSYRNAKSKSGTGTIYLVPRRFRTSCQRVPPCITNFGSGALGRDERLENRPDVVPNHQIGNIVEFRRLAIDDCEPRPVALGHQRKSGGRPHDQR
jgi:hypothetical protein